MGKFLEEGICEEGAACSKLQGPQTRWLEGLARSSRCTIRSERQGSDGERAEGRTSGRQNPSEPARTSRFSPRPHRDTTLRRRSAVVNSRVFGLSVQLVDPPLAVPPPLPPPPSCGSPSTSLAPPPAAGRGEGAKTGYSKTSNHNNISKRWLWKSSKSVFSTRTVKFTDVNALVIFKLHDQTTFPVLGWEGHLKGSNRLLAHWEASKS